MSAYGGGKGYVRRGKPGVYTDRFGQKHQADSRLEMRRMAVLDFAGLRFRREAIKIPYLFEGRRRSYYTDLLVFDRWQRPMRIEEIKPGARALQEHPENLAKWAAARAWCASRYDPPIEFRVVTEATLGAP